MAESINEILAKTIAGGTITLPSGEFEGPIYITRPMHVIGNNTTIWAKRGNAVEISSADVILDNVRVELTSSRLNGYAISAALPVKVNNVEIFGAIHGFGPEDVRFEIPRTLDLGRFAADKVNTFTIRLTVPTAAEICCDTAGLTFSPTQLQPGDNQVTITASDFNAMFSLFAEVLIKSRFTRRVFVTGKPVAGIEPVNGKTLPSGEYAPTSGVSVKSFPVTHSEQSAEDYNAYSKQMYIPPQELPLLDMRKGQRFSLLPYTGSRFDISFYCRKPAHFEIDPYVFLIDETGQCFDSRCLVFFGNNTSIDGSVEYHPDDGHISVDLHKIDQRVSKVMVVYSIYGGNAAMSFASVAAPNMRLSSEGRDRMSYSIYNLGNTPTVIACELYRYGGEWKISAIGWGFQEGIAKLCNNYGINTY